MWQRVMSVLAPTVVVEAMGMSTSEFRVGRFTITIEADAIRLTGYTASSDCGHTVSGETIAVLRAALGLDGSANMAEHLRTLEGADADRIHELFIAHATDNFAWWDPDDMGR
jgi:hypothetical protein